MKDRKPINDTLAIAGQPTEADLEQLAQEGFKSVVNVRHLGEDQMPMTPEQEGEKVRELGMTYRHVPVSMKDPGPELLDQFRAAMAGLPGPTLVHCKGGTRAGVMAVADLAVQQGLSGEQAVEQARALGLGVDQNPKLAAFIRTAVDARRGA